MNHEHIKMILIDNQELFREGILKIMQTEPVFHMITSGDHFISKVPLLESYDVDILLIHLSMFKEHEETIQQLMTKHSPTLKVIILATLEDENYVSEAVKMGVRGYILREMDAKTFIQSIHAVHEGLLYIHPLINDALLNHFMSYTVDKTEEEIEIKPPKGFYTKREYEVLQLLAKGHSNRKIADHLKISDKTVKNHISSIFKKMDVNDRTKAVVTAVKNQWVRI